MVSSREVVVDSGGNGALLAWAYRGKLTLAQSRRCALSLCFLPEHLLE